MAIALKKGIFMRAILIDDEYYALEGLRMELEGIDDIEVVGMYDSGEKMLSEVSSLNPDIIFIDIEMPVMSGLEVFKRLIDIEATPNIIFVTAYSQYAVQAFELRAMDYIMKPVTRTRLIKAIKRISYEPRPNKGNKFSIKCFSHFSIIYDGEEINRSWRTGKSEELLAYLISECGKFVSKEKIADALWPELDGDKSVSNLYLAYYYAKKEMEKIGVSLPIFSVRGKMRFDTGVDCDLTRFLTLINEIPSHTGINRIETMEKAVSYYIGIPFEDKYYSWLSTFQQICEVKYSEMLYEVIEYYKSIWPDNRKVQRYEKLLLALTD